MTFPYCTCMWQIDLYVFSKAYKFDKCGFLSTILLNLFVYPTLPCVSNAFMKIWLVHHTNVDFFFFVVQSVTGKRSDRGGQHNLLLPSTIEWGIITDIACTVVTWCFMDGNAIFTARSESGQGIRSIYICLCMCHWISSINHLTGCPGENWRLECHILKVAWIVHLFPKILLILPIRVPRSC